MGLELGCKRFQSQSPCPDSNGPYYVQPSQFLSNGLLSKITHSNAQSPIFNEAMDAPLDAQADILLLHYSCDIYIHLSKKRNTIFYSYSVQIIVFYSIVIIDIMLILIVIKNVLYYVVKFCCYVMMKASHFIKQSIQCVFIII